MWPRRITSGTEKYPKAKDVFALLLSDLIQNRVETSWAHFESVSENGWFSNLLSGREPWIEVAFCERCLELNIGIPKSQRSLLPTVPAKWNEKNNGTQNVPVEDSKELMGWMDKCFSTVSGRDDYKISGWIEGK
jgi:hypothetical protein